MTRRGFWFLAVAGGTLVLSLALPYQFSLSLFGLTGLAWCAFEWALFRLRADRVVRRLRVERRINGQPAGRAVLWEGRPAHVQLRISTASWLGLPWIRVVDLRPATAESRGVWSTEGPCRRGASLEISYEIVPKLPGRVGFDGIQVESSDGPGFFTDSTCLRERLAVMVLPSLTPEHGMRTLYKRDNRIPAHGMHRHLRPGAGTDLLNLRDYVVGDPPKRIAWKVSARRDRLITKEYESEVPVRAWLFLDVSDSVRVGWPGPTPLDQSVRIAAALTRELLAQRDPVGLVLIDDDHSAVLSPAPGPRQQTRILGELCRIAGNPPKPSPCHPSLLYDPVEALCRSRYPDLADRRLHRRLLREDWPLSRIVGWPLGVLLFVVGIVLATSPIWLRGDIPYSGPALIVVGIAIVAWAVNGVVAWRRGRGSSLAAVRRRRKIAPVIAAVQHLGPAGLARLMHDDAAFSRHAQQFLIDHQCSYARPLHDAKGKYLYRSPQKIERTARALLRAVAHGRDNEVFVLLVDLLEHENHWDSLIEAMKVARSRRHQVILVCPWPAELMSPTSGDRRRGKSLDLSLEANDLHFEHLLSERYFRAYDDASSRLAAVGIPLLVATVRDTPREILRRVEMVRAARIPAHA